MRFSLSLSFVTGLGDDWAGGFVGRESTMLSSEDEGGSLLSGVVGALSNLSYEGSCGCGSRGISGGALLLNIYRTTSRLNNMLLALVLLTKDTVRMQRYNAYCNKTEHNIVTQYSSHPLIL